jgi:L-lactate utilization protein LutB
MKTQFQHKPLRCYLCTDCLCLCSVTCTANSILDYHHSSPVANDKPSTNDYLDGFRATDW